MASVRRSAHSAKVVAWCTEHIPQWVELGVTKAQLGIHIVTGGLSNLIDRVCIEDDTLRAAAASAGAPHTVLIRTFRTDENLTDPDAEQTIFEACDRAGIAPRMYAVDRGGLGVRAEEFIEGTTMSLSQLRSLDFELRAAPMIAQLHSVKVPLDSSSPWIVTKINSWMKTVAKVGPTLEGTAGDQWRELRALMCLETEVEWLANTLYPHLTRVCDTGSDVGPMDIVFCHNDLQEGNWIVKPDGSFKIIDYEYGGYNFRAYDIANLFCECGYEYTFPKHPFFSSVPTSIPELAQRRKVCAAYVNAVRELEQGRSIDERKDGSDTSLDSADGPGAGALDTPRLEPHDELVDAYVRAARGLALGAHMLWTLWGVILAHEAPPIEFGYMEHSLARARDYLRIKAQLVAVERLEDEAHATIE